MLPFLVAVLLTAAVCTVVFAGQYMLSLLDEWLQERADERAALDRLDACVLDELGTVCLVCPPEVRHD